MKKQIEYLQKLFYDLWNDFGSVYLLVKYSDRTVIGKRGFTDDEKKQGLILVFSNKTNNRLEWDSEGNITCVLAFGTRKEEVRIHHDDLLGIFSPEAGVQFVRSDMDQEPALTTEASPPKAAPGRGRQVVSIDKFRKRKAR